AMHLGAARVAVEVAGTASDELADRLGAAMGARVTFIDDDGVVVGDSGLTAEQLAHTENHAHRPEVADASAAGRGRDRRTSATVHKDMLYLAERWTSAAAIVGVIAGDPATPCATPTLTPAHTGTVR